MSAFDGKVLRRLIRGERNLAFENVPSLRSSITWSPTGDRLALAAKSSGRDVIYIVAAQDGRVLKRFDLTGCEALTYPAWSPVSDSLVVVGLREGRSDLWLLDVGTGHYRRLTDDAWDEKEPTWTPDGTAITFSSDRAASVVLHPVKTQSGFGHYGIFQLRLSDRAIDEVIDNRGGRSLAGVVSGRIQAGVHLRSRAHAQHVPLRHARLDRHPAHRRHRRRLEPHLVARERRAGVLRLQLRRASTCSPLREPVAVDAVAVPHPAADAGGGAERGRGAHADLAGHHAELAVRSPRGALGRQPEHGAGHGAHAAGD
jgi:hypothetical protein